MKSTLFFAVTALFLNSTFAFASDYPGYTTIFTLERTTNDNQVVYEADLTNSDAPIHPYWIMKADDGQIEELNGIERSRAYGVDVISQSDTEVQFNIVSFSSHPITVKIDPASKKPYATMDLDSGTKIIEDFFLTVSGGLFPSVKNVDVSYRNTLTGPTLKDSFDPRD